MLARGWEYVSAVPVAGCAERRVADELPEHAQRYGAPGRRDEYDRARRSIHEFLQVATPRKGFAARPLPHPMATAGRERLHQPAAPSNLAGGFAVNGGRGVTASAERGSDNLRIPDITDHFTCVAPKCPVGGKALHGVGMILETGQIHHRIALDAASSQCRIFRGITLRRRESTHKRVLVKIGECIDRCRLEAGAGRRFGRRPCRNTCKKNTFRSESFGSA